MKRKVNFYDLFLSLDKVNALIIEIRANSITNETKCG